MVVVSRNMNARLLAGATLLAVLGVFAGLEARSLKDNVGASLPEAALSFSGAAPQWTGRPLVLEFWATSCSSCRESVPHLNALYRKFKERGIETIGVTDDGEVEVKAFMKDVQVDYPIGYDRRGRFASALGITGIPHAMLVDKSGTIIWEGHPMQLQESQLEELAK